MELDAAHKMPAINACIAVTYSGPLRLLPLLPRHPIAVLQSRITNHESRMDSYRAEQGVGFQPLASGSFLKSEVVMYGPRKYCGSSTLVVTVSH
jgi:hypothetical protein